MAGTHAFLAPSGAYRWAAVNGCRAAARMERQFPEDKDGQAARGGTAAHWYGSTALITSIPPQVETLAPNGVPIDDEMVECGDLYVRHVMQSWATAGAPAMRVEEYVSARAYIHEQCGGTPDVYWVNRQTKTVTIKDYKYGHGYVDEWNNLQLIIYAIAVLESEGITDWTGWTIETTIIQPRCYSAGGFIRSHSYTGQELWDWAQAIRAAAIEAVDPNAPYRTGSHCLHCSAVTNCPAALKVGGVSIDISEQGAPLEMSPETLGLLLRQTKAAMARLDALHTGLIESGMAMIRRGQGVPGFGVKMGQGNLAWDVAAEEVLALGDMMGVSLANPKKMVITPTQAKALIDPAIIEQYTKIPSTGLKLVPVTDDVVSRAFGGK